MLSILPKMENLTSCKNMENNQANLLLHLHFTRITIVCQVTEQNYRKGSGRTADVNTSKRITNENNARDVLASQHQ